MIETLGSVVTTSGDLLLVDFGSLTLWSGADVPVIEDGLLDPESTRAWNTASDFEFAGPDAAAVADSVDSAQLKGRFVFDVLAGHADETREQMTAACDGRAAEFRAVPRMPHLARVRALLDESPGGAEIPFPGGWATAVRGLPVGRPLPVRGQRMAADGADAGRWHSVWVECGPGRPVRSVEAGVVLVDEARLAFAEPAALSRWRTDECVDGLADVVLWGRDEDAVAAEFDAPEVVEGDSTVRGWLDLPVGDALDLAGRLEARRGAGDVRFAFDVRPHDDHHVLLEQARSSVTGSGTLELGDDVAVGFFTTWGDGAFVAYRDLDAAGELVGFRVELGSPQIVARTRRMELMWSGEFARLAIVTPQVAAGAPVQWLERDAPRADEDSGWCLYSGLETDDDLSGDAATLVPLRELIQRQPELEEVLRAPAPAAFEVDEDGRFVAIPG